jgi:hypothetical protein
MTPLPPWWRRIYDTVEKPLGDALAAGARSGAFGDAMALSIRVPRRVQKEVERRTRHILHFANLPTATDVRRLTVQVTLIQREVRSLARAVEELPTSPATNATKRRNRAGAG